MDQGRKKFQDVLLNLGARFERDNADSDKVWFSPKTGRLFTVPTKPDAVSVEIAMRAAGFAA